MRRVIKFLLSISLFIFLYNNVLYALNIRWYGHSCFLITSDKGVRILTDPYGRGVGYEIPRVKADIVTISHEHFDHNNVEMIENRDEALILRGIGSSGDWNPINKRIGDISIYNVPLYHDHKRGLKRGKNSGFVYEIDGLRLLHLGDLGHLLSRDQLDRIGKIDILFIPVGGVYTIDAEEAREVVAQINPKIIIPMHYKTAPVILPIEPLDAFISEQDNVERLGSNNFNISRKDLPDTPKIVILNYK